MCLRASDVRVKCVFVSVVCLYTSNVFVRE